MKKSKIKMLICAVIIINIGYIILNQQITMHRIKNSIVAKQSSVKNLKAQSKKLQDQIKLSKTDKYSEVLARERLNLIKEGETPVIDTNNK
ncbi:FtsB family cell division protein [Clostridium hydrogenum]|uniref:FtsB family cell division protein n=1 Tax=Clostridium hydrogenum TaxID=2855764 RepID=UPI002E37B7AE|nr:septum formation initiator family protein [Clostridium hydrogenum]